MRRFVFALASAAALAAGPVTAQVYVGSLSGAAEVPPSASTGNGTVVLTYAPATFLLKIEVAFADLIGTSSAAHIHCCITMPNSNAGVATQVPTFVGFPLGVSAGTYSNTFDLSLAASYNPSFVNASGGVEAARARILEGLRSGTAYFNIHTQTFPAGEIRADFVLDLIFADGVDGL